MDTVLMLVAIHNKLNGDYECVHKLSYNIFCYTVVNGLKYMPKILIVEDTIDILAILTIIIYRKAMHLQRHLVMKTYRENKAAALLKSSLILPGGLIK
ncbi:MAG: hypothetical protein ABIU77_01305 [Ferruginibacter sp.]